MQGKPGCGTSLQASLGGIPRAHQRHRQGAQPVCGWFTPWMCRAERHLTTPLPRQGSRWGHPAGWGRRGLQIRQTRLGRFSLERRTRSIPTSSYLSSKCCSIVGARSVSKTPESESSRYACHEGIRSALTAWTLTIQQSPRGVSSHEEPRHRRTWLRRPNLCAATPGPSRRRGHPLPAP